MSEAKITPDEVRAHLRLDDDLSGEGELLKMYTDAALEACQKHIGKRFEDGLEFTPAMRVGCLMYIAFLYENRKRFHQWSTRNCLWLFLRSGQFIVT